MSPTPEQEARQEIDRMLEQAGWLVQDVKNVNLHAGRGVAIREFPLERGFGIAEFRTSPMPRIAVTVDMIATGTDIKPFEIVFFMRMIRSRSFFEQMKGRGVRVAELIEKPPYLWRIDRLWDAYAALEQSKVKGAGSRRLWTDIVSLVRFALHQEPLLEPFEEHVHERFAAWIAKQEAQGKTFNAEQRWWLERIRDHVIGSIEIGRDDFEFTPFKENGGIGKVYQLFGEELWGMLEELNEVLAA
nr:type I restriction-modification enzyme R subunit C-terminal domain-containing protein [Pelotalea chapellei]